MKNTTNNPFWKDVLSYLSSFIKRYTFMSKNEAVNSSFLCSSKIKTGNLEIKDRVLKENSIFFIRQLMTEERFMTYGEFKDKYNININTLRYLSIVSSIKKYIKDIPSSNFEKQYKYPPAF